MWSPQSESLQQLVTILRNAVSNDNHTRHQATKQLEEAKKQPDLNYYLVYILANPETAEDEVRSTAGSLLKLHVLQQFTQIPPECLEYIKEQSMKALSDQKPMVRAFSSNVVTSIFQSGGARNWIKALPELMSMAEGNKGQSGQLGSMAALSKICEDCGRDLDQEFDGERPLNYLIPKFLEFATNASNPKIRSQAIFCLIQFIIQPTQSLLSNIDQFLNVLFGSATDGDADIRKNVCSAFVNLLEVRPDKLVPHLEGVINYGLHCIKDEDELVASEGGEFVLALADNTEITDAMIEPHLNNILPVILPAMVYSEDDRTILELQAEDDEQQEDRAEDMRPTNAKSSGSHTVASSNNKENNNNNDGSEKNKNKNKDENDSDSDDDDDDDEMDVADWSLRKCCAATFDVLSTRFGQQILEISLPYLKEKIVSDDWAQREAAILGFGAIAEGCMELLTPHLAELIPFLVQRLSDNSAPVRQMACWTLGRYCSWVVQNMTAENHEKFFVPVLQGLLTCCLDKNKKVQEAGCSAFATFTEQAGEELIPYLEAILMHFNMCFQKYKNKNLMVLYDAVQTLTDHVSIALCEPKYIDLLLPPLMKQWSKLEDDDRDLCPLFECLSSVTACLGESFAPYAPPVFERAMRVLKDTLVQEQVYQEDPQNIDPPEKDFVIVALDLLDGLVQGLGHHSAELLQQNSNPPLLEMLMMCFRDEVNEVRQSTFALLGDMVILTFDQVQGPYFDQVIKETINQISIEDYESRRVCNNATWTVGEIALQADRSALEPYSQQLFQRLITILQANKQTSRMVQENAAIALARLGKNIPDLISPNLTMFIDKWCELMHGVEETDEKDSAFKGMCQIVGANPSGLSNEKSLITLIETMGLYRDPSPELAVLIQKLLQGYKNFVQDWQGMVMNKLPQPVAQTLIQRYNV